MFTHDQVEKRAHELYLARGCGDGRALNDWLDAEFELLLEASMAILAAQGELVDV